MTRQQITNRIKTGLKKKGEHFSVKNHSERMIATQEAKFLKRYELIDFEITTHANADGTFSIFRV